MGLFEIEFFDLRTLTLEDHLQVLSVTINLVLIFSSITVVPIFMVFLLFYSRWWFLVPIYVAWIYYDRNTAFTGGRKWVLKYWFLFLSPHKKTNNNVIIFQFLRSFWKGLTFHHTTTLDPQLSFYSARNTDYIEKYFKQNLCKISFSIKTR